MTGPIILILCSVFMLAACLKFTLFFWNWCLSWPTCICSVVMFVIVSSAPVSPLELQEMAERRFIFALGGLIVIGLVYMFYTAKKQLGEDE